MFKEEKIKKWIVILPLLGVIFTSIVLTVFHINKIQTFYNNEFKLIQIQNKQKIKDSIKSKIDIISELVENNFSLDNHYDKKYILNKTQKLLNQINFSGKGYIFAYDFQGNTIAHIKKELIGTNRWSLQHNNKFLVQEMIKGAKKTSAGFFYEYKATINPKTNLPEQKISYIKSLNNINWVIGTGVYLDSLESSIKERERELNDDLISSINKILLISLLVTLLGIIIMMYLSNKIYAIFNKYQNVIVQKNIELEKKVIKRTQDQQSLLELFDKADSILFKWDYNKQKFTYMSKNLMHILGLKVNDLKNNKGLYKDFIHKDDIERFNAEYENTIKNGVNYFEHTPYRIVTRDKKIKWIHDCKLLVRNHNSDLSYLICYMTDITQMKEQENILIEQTKMFALNEMIKNIAHQWRQPLCAISTAASGIKLHNELNILETKTLHEFIDGIIYNSNHLSETINLFDDFSSANKKETKLTIEDLINKNLKLIDCNIKPNEIKVITNIEKDLFFYGNEQELMQVMMHILNNSIDELLKKSYQSKKIIIIETINDKSNLIIKIKDNAGGIEPEYIDRIFEPYFTTKHQSFGAGLDLYISKKIIQDLKGDLTVKNLAFNYEANRYRGALFTIILPLQN